MSAARTLWLLERGGFVVGIGAATWACLHAGDAWWLGALACLAYVGGTVSGSARTARR